MTNNNSQAQLMQTPIEPHNATLVEKTPLETYVPPARPSLIGLSRAELAERLGEIGVAPAQRKMRVQQLWHWIYFRGAQRARQALHGRSPRGGRRADLQ
jgi:23S rRNA (adenine2503-C2)-methyltransferase